MQPLHTKFDRFRGQGPNRVDVIPSSPMAFILRGNTLRRWQGFFFLNKCPDVFAILEKSPVLRVKSLVPRGLAWPGKGPLKLVDDLQKLLNAVGDMPFELTYSLVIKQSLFRVRASGANISIPCAQSVQITNQLGSRAELPAEIVVSLEIVYATASRGLSPGQLILSHIVAHHGPGGNHGSEFQVNRRDDTGIPADKDPSRSQQASGRIPHQAGKFVAPGIEVEMNCAGADFAMIAPRTASGQKHVAIVNGGTRDHASAEDGVFQAHVVREGQHARKRQSGRLAR